MKKSGFTLVELMVVIVIIGILAAVALPNMLKSADRARVSEVGTILRSVSDAVQVHQRHTGEWVNSSTAQDWDDIGMEEPESKWFNYGISAGGGSQYRVYATPKAGFGFGDLDAADTVYIEDGAKGFVGDGFQQYMPNWN